MSDGSLLVLDGSTVAGLLAGREEEVVGAVRSAYAAHGAGRTALPHSLFLRFPDQPRDRIIALPAYLAAERKLAGVKWIASFPGNVARGEDRASAVLVLNSTETGQPYAVLEGSAISAQRTAASAALAARHLWPAAERACVSVVGCGLIAWEIVSYLHRTAGRIGRVVVHDLSEGRARDFAARCAGAFPGVPCEVAPDLEAALAGGDVVVFATTAAKPYVGGAAPFRAGATVLNVSLRDLAPEVILASDNIVDDPDHVCRAETSVALAEAASGGRGFIRGTIADLVSGAVPPRVHPDDVVVFSPFGLGVLDLAVAGLVMEGALAGGLGVRIPAFLPRPWNGGPG